jgi:DNA-binding NarL/FixJ family response regulator
MSKTALIIDDHPFMREGLRAVIEREDSFLVSAEAGSAKEGLEFARANKPDVILLDLGLPDANGLNIIPELLQASPASKIIVVSVHSKVEYVSQAFKAGAVGFVVKESAAETLIDAMGSVLAGNVYLDGNLSRQVVQTLMDLPSGMEGIRDERYGTLTPREQQVLRMLAEGLSCDEIGGKLFISPRTAENHRSSIMRKLGVHSPVELVRYAARLGIIDVDLWKEPPADI